MTADNLFQEICTKKSFLCVGLDPDLSRFPESVLESEDPVYEFNKRVIDATCKYAVAYKPNIAFYEVLGSAGLWSLEKTVEYIRKKYPEVLLIADAKRGDIGNSSSKYASAWFDNYGFDAVTVAPYMGKDSVQPFLGYKGKWTILLALTSNPGAMDFQLIKDADTGKMLFEKVIEDSSKWGTPDNLMYVVGSTRSDLIDKVRAIVPDNFLLVPGVGDQGGSLEDVARGINKRCGLLVNSSRAIIHASEEEDFDIIAGEKAALLQSKMELILKQHQLIG